MKCDFFTKKNYFWATYVPEEYACVQYDKRSFAYIHVVNWISFISDY